MNFTEICKEQKSAEPTAKEQLEQIGKAKEQELENTLLKVALAQSSERCEELLKELTALQAQAEQNRQNESENLQNSVANLQTANEMLSEGINRTIEALVDDLRVRTSSEVKNSLQRNLDATEKYLQEFEKKKNRFFQFGTAQTVFFWLGTVTNAMTFAMLVYMLFVK